MAFSAVGICVRLFFFALLALVSGYQCIAQFLVSCCALAARQLHPWRFELDFFQVSYPVDSPKNSALKRTHTHTHTQSFQLDFQQLILWPSKPWLLNLLVLVSMYLGLDRWNNFALYQTLGGRVEAYTKSSLSSFKLNTMRKTFLQKWSPFQFAESIKINVLTSSVKQITNVHISFKLCNHLSARNINSEGRDQMKTSRAVLSFSFLYFYMMIETTGNCFLFFLAGKGLHSTVTINHDTLPEQVHLWLWAAETYSARRASLGTPDLCVKRDMDGGQHGEGERSVRDRQRARQRELRQRLPVDLPSITVTATCF